MRHVFNRAVLVYGGSPAIVENSDGSVDGEYMLKITDFHDDSINVENTLAPIPHSLWISSGCIVKPPNKSIESEDQYIVWHGGIRLLANPQQGKWSAINFDTARDIAKNTMNDGWTEPHILLVRLFWEPEKVTVDIRREWRAKDVRP